MPMRALNLQSFVDQAARAFSARAVGEQTPRTVAKIFANLARPQDAKAGGASRLPVCDRHLSEAADPAHFHDTNLADLAKTFLSIEPLLKWRRRPGGGPAASGNFEDGHANAMIIGPGGFEPRTDVWLGVSLLAPDVRYPDHFHAPEEVYLVMSPGEFSQGEGPWFAPGIGGSFYNPPGIVHAMRSGAQPLFAFWLLLTNKTPDMEQP